LGQNPHGTPATLLPEIDVAVMLKSVDRLRKAVTRAGYLIAAAVIIAAMF
jgi:hypothetical protein